MAERGELPEALLDALYRVVSDPDSWEEFVDALPETALDPHSLGPDLRRGLEIAERVAPKRTVRAPRSRGQMTLDMRLVIRAADDAAVAIAGRELVGRPAPFADDDSEHVVRQAMGRLARAGAAVVMFRLAGVEAALVGRLSPHPDGAALSFSRMTAAGADHLGLTPAEARLVAALSHADGLKDAAASLGVSLNTARNQLASIFEKLGVRSQSDLARLLSEVAQHEPEAAGEDGWPARQTFVLQDGRRLVYRSYGDAAAPRVALTFHDGMGASMTPIETEAVARACGLRVVAAERPGFGGSDPLRTYSFEAVAADMEALCDHLGLAEVALVGLLSGTAPMLATAARLGSRVRKAVILSGRPPGAPQETGNPLLKFRASMVRHPRLTQAAFAILRTRISPRTIERMLKRAGSAGDQAYLAANPQVATFLSRHTAEALEGGGVGPAAELAISGAEPTFHLADVTAPLEVHHGAEDGLSPLAPLQAYLGNRPYALTVYPDIGQLMAMRHWGAILASL